VRSAYGVPEGMLEKGVERLWVIAARGGTASVNESEFLAMKSAVEAGAIVFVCGGVEIEPSSTGAEVLVEERIGSVKGQL
jgi:hypothetical protein